MELKQILVIGLEPDLVRARESHCDSSTPVAYPLRILGETTWAGERCALGRAAGGHDPHGTASH